MLIWLRIAALSSCFLFGWYCHVVYTGYRAEKAATKAITKLGEGQNEIIRFNQALDKGLAATKDDCIAKPIPDAIRVLIK